MASNDMNTTLGTKDYISEMMAHLQEVDARIEEQVQRISTVSGEIDRHVGDAVRALQFEDIVTQLVESSRGGVEGMDDYLAGVREILQDIADEDSHGANYARRLQQAREALVERRSRREQERAGNRVVEQGSMDEGDVELF